MNHSTFMSHDFNYQFTASSRLSEDHKRAQRLANLVNIHGGATFKADYHSEFSTNFVYVRIAAGSNIRSKDLLERLERVTEAEAAREICPGGPGEGRRVRVRAMAMGTANLRFALHLNVGEQGWASISETKLYLYMNMLGGDYWFCDILPNGTGFSIRSRYQMADGIFTSINLFFSVTNLP